MRHPTSPKRARNRLKVIRGEVAVLVGERKRLEPYSEWHGPELDRIRKQLNSLDAEAKRIEANMKEVAI